MLGKLNPEIREVTVIGGGISGLLAAYRLDQAGYEVTLHEASDRLGGLIHTEQTPWGISESAAHSFLATPAVVRLCAELGVELIPVCDDSRSRFVWRGGKLRKFPLGLFEILRTFFRAYFILADRKLDPSRLSMEEWAKRFLGEPALKYALTPFLRGIYGAKPSEITVGAAFPKLVVPYGNSFLSSMIMKKVTRKKQFQSKLPGSELGPRRMMTPRNGMGDLVDRLEGHLKKKLGDRLKTSSVVSELPQNGNLVLAVPASVASELLKKGDAALSRALGNVVYTPLVCATAFVPKSQVKGVGVLVPETEKRKALGILFNSSSFENRVQDAERFSSFTVILGGSSNPEMASASDSEITRIATRELKEMLRIAEDPVHLEIRKWPKAVPQYGTQLMDTWKLTEEGWCSKPGRVLFANYTGQVSLRGMIESLAGFAPRKT